MSTYSRVGPRDELPDLVHRQDAQRERKWNAPEHPRNGRGVEHLLEPGPVQVYDADQRGGDHSRGDGQVAARTPERVGLEDGDTPVGLARREKTSGPEAFPFSSSSSTMLHRLISPKEI